MTTAESDADRAFGAAVDGILSEVCEAQGVAVSSSFAAGCRTLLRRHLATLVLDCCAFAQHRGRSRIGPEDVFLLCRRDTKLLQRLMAFSEARSESAAALPPPVAGAKRARKPRASHEGGKAKQVTSSAVRARGVGSDAEEEEEGVAAAMRGARTSTDGADGAESADDELDALQRAGGQIRTSASRRRGVHADAGLGVAAVGGSAVAAAAAHTPRRLRWPGSGGGDEQVAAASAAEEELGVEARGVGDAEPDSSRQLPGSARSHEENDTALASIGGRGAADEQDSDAEFLNLPLHSGGTPNKVRKSNVLLSSDEEDTRWP